MSPINPHLQKHRNMVRRGIGSEKWGEKWEEGLMGVWNGTFRRVWNDEQSMYIVPNTMLWLYGSCRVNRDSCDWSFLVELLSSLHSVSHTRVIAIHFGCDWGGLKRESQQSLINRGKPSKTILLRQWKWGIWECVWWKGWWIGGWLGRELATLFRCCSSFQSHMYDGSLRVSELFWLFSVLEGRC